MYRKIHLKIFQIKLSSLVLSVSDNVTQLSVVPQGPTNDNNEYSANVTITWTVPCKSNGEIEYFQLSFRGSRANYNPVAFQRMVGLDTENVKGRMSYTETEMQPQYAYTVQVQVKNREVDELSDSVSGSWESPAGCESNFLRIRLIMPSQVGFPLEQGWPDFVPRRTKLSQVSERENEVTDTS